ncbi:hypothetical protein DITRI_Ditri14bG0064800 [Diplodiscus trichospermus]
MDEVIKLRESMRKKDLFPDSQTYTEIIRSVLKDESHTDALNIYEDMIVSRSTRGVAIQDFNEGTSATSSSDF